MHDILQIFAGFLFGFGLCLNIEASERLTRFLVRKIKKRLMEKLFKECINTIILCDEISRRAKEFEEEDLEAVDLDTEYAVKILSDAGFTFDEVTSAWKREVPDDHTV